MQKTFLFLLLHLFFIVGAFSSTLDIVDVPSLCMGKSFKACVITPDAYLKSTKHFSVMYFLHGFSGNYSVWPRVAPLAEYSDKYSLIFVCPDGGYDSWYIDSPVKPNSKFETYVIKEVVPFVDAHYRTWNKSSGRAISGSSMGGHGAMTLLAKHPDMFCGASSLSGIMDLTQFPHEWDLASVLGAYDDNRESWKIKCFIGLLKKLQGEKKKLILDSGISDFARQGNRAAHEMLTALNIDHEYFNHPGGHSPLYCRQNIESHIRFFANSLDSPGTVMDEAK